MHVDLDSALSFPSHLFWRGHLIGGEWGEIGHEALSMREAAFFLSGSSAVGEGWRGYHRASRIQIFRVIQYRAVCWNDEILH